MDIDFSKVEWASVLVRLGLDKKYLEKKAGPCPICESGTDRFSFVNKGGMGTWFCRKCGGGNGFTLIRKLFAMPDWEIMKELYDGSSGAVGTPIKAFKAPVDEFSPAQVLKNRKKLKQAWDPTVPLSKGDPVVRYMESRVPGIDFTKFSRHVKFNPGLEYYHEYERGKFKLLGRFSTMLARVIDATGAPITLHRTFLTRDGDKASVPEPKKQMKGIRKLAGELIPLLEVPESRTLGLTEGIETGWAVAVASNYSINVSAALNCGNLGKAIVESGRYDRVIIFADHDELDEIANFRPGEHHALLLKARLEEAGIKVVLKIPKDEGTDFADVWMKMYLDNLAKQGSSQNQTPPRVTAGVMVQRQSGRAESTCSTHHMQ